MHSQQEATLSDLAAARQELLDALAGLSEADLESPLGPDQWGIRDMLARINHWNRWGQNRLRHIVKHGEETRPAPASIADAVNRLVAEAWALCPLKHVLIGFKNCYEDVVAFIRSLPPGWTEGVWQYGGKKLEPMVWLCRGA